MRLIEGELRKTYESLNRQCDSFYQGNPRLDPNQIGKTRQLLTHDYAEVDAKVLWRLVKDEAPRLLALLRRAKSPGK